MPTLDQLYEDTDAKEATHRVIVGGVQLTTVRGLTWRFGIGVVPTATIRVDNPIPQLGEGAGGAGVTGVTYFADVSIDVGFDNVMVRQFTGKVWNINPDERGADIECMGMSWPLDVTYHKVIKALNNIDATDAVEDLLDDAGILDYKVDLPAWMIGTAAVQTLEFSTYGEGINRIAEVDGAGWFEMPDGMIKVQRVDWIPAMVAHHNYFSMRLTGLVESYPSGIPSGRPRLRSVEAEEQTRDIKNQAFVRGATVVQVNPDGSESTTEIEADASAASPWVLNPDGSQAYNDYIFANELIDTLAKAQDVAARLVYLYNRLLTNVPAEVDGDPRVQIYQTVRMEDPDYSRITGRWVLMGYASRLSSEGFATALSLKGGDEAGGQINLAPNACFDWAVEREVIADREWAVVTFDASCSDDRDGTIASYAWSDNQAPQIAIGAAPVFTVRVDPDTLDEPWEVTLTVTDDLGATDAVMHTIDIGPTARDVYVPAVYVAFDSHFSCSPDGGLSWNDQAYGAAPVDTVAAAPQAEPGIAVFGITGPGDQAQIWRTTDYLASAPTQVFSISGEQIVDMEWPWWQPSWVFALTATGKIYRSIDEGASWDFLVDLRTRLGISVATRLSLHVRAGIFVFGARPGGIPAICWSPDNGITWGSFGIAGELGADIIATPTADLVIADGIGRQQSGELGIILNSATFQPSVYYTTNVQDPSLWIRALAPPAKSRGRWIANDAEVDRFVMAWDDDVMYRGDVAAGVMTIAAAPATLDPGDESHHGVPISIAYPSVQAGVYLVAGEGAADGTVYKTWDRFANIGKLRPATGFPAALAGMNAKMVAIGRAVPYQGRAGRVALVHPGAGVGPIGLGEHGNFGVYNPTADTWAMQYTDASKTNRVNYRSLGGILWRIHSQVSLVRPGDLERSLDDGVSWPVSLPAVDRINNWGIAGYCRSPSGYLFAVESGTTIPDGKPLKIYRSKNNGDTWEVVHTIPDTGVASARGGPIAADPEDADGRIFLVVRQEWFFSGFVYSLDDGDTWASITPTTPPAIPAALYHAELYFGQGGRLVYNPGDSLLSANVYYSNDGADNWIAAAPNLAPLFSGQRQMIYAGNGIFYLCGHLNIPASAGRIYRSGDNGANWTMYLQGELLVITDPDGVQTIWGITFDGPSQTLYAHCNDIDEEQGGAAMGEPILKRPEGGGWANATGDAETAFQNPPFLVPERNLVAPIDCVVHEISYGKVDLTGWDRSPLPCVIDHERPRPTCLTALLWYVVDVGGFPDPEKKSVGSEHVHPAVRSTDGGAGWVATPIGDEAPGPPEVGGLAHIVQDADGWLWGARKQGSVPADPVQSDIYFSNDQGASWIPSDSLSVAGATRRPIRLIAHLLDRNIIALISSQTDDGGDERCLTHITLDRGATWNTYGATVASGNNFPVNNDLLLAKWWAFVGDARLIAIHGPDAGPTRFYTSDDWGQIWSQRQEDTTAQTNHMLAGTSSTGHKIVTLRVPRTGAAPEPQAFVSTNFGISYSAIGPTLPGPGAGDFGPDWGAKYVEADDALYVWNANLGAGTLRVQRLAPISDGAVWVDITADLVDQAGGWDEMDYIPR